MTTDPTDRILETAGDALGPDTQQPDPGVPTELLELYVALEADNAAAELSAAELEALR